MLAAVFGIGPLPISARAVFVGMQICKAPLILADQVLTETVGVSGLDYSKAATGRPPLHREPLPADFE